MAILRKVRYSSLEPPPLNWLEKPTEICLLDHNYCLIPGNYKSSRDDIDSSEDENLDFKIEQYPRQNLNDIPWMYRADRPGNEYEANGITQAQLLDPCSSNDDVMITSPNAFGLKRELKTRPRVRVRFKKERNTKPTENLKGDEYKCSTCLYITGDENMFRVHLRKHRLHNLKIKECDVVLTKENNFQCKKCNFKTKFIQRFKYHLKRHDTAVTIENDSSNKYVTEEAAKEHDGINKQFGYRLPLKIHQNKGGPLEKGEPPKSVNTLVEKSSFTTQVEQHFAEKPSKLIITEVGSLDIQLLVKEESTESKGSNQAIEIYVLGFDSTENVDPLRKTTFNLERSDQYKHTLHSSNGECCDLVTKYKKYLDMSQDVQICDIETSAERNESIKEDVQEECKIFQEKISELFSKQAEGGLLDHHSLDKQNLLLQETLEPKEVNYKIDDRMKPCTSKPSNLEPGDQSEIQLQQSNKHILDSNKFKCNLCDFVSNYKKYLCLHMSRHEKPVKLRWHKERKKRLVKVGFRRRRRTKISGPININKTYTGFKCYEKNCYFITNVKEYLDLHVENHLRLAQAGSNTVTPKPIPNLVLKEQQNTDTVYETLKGFKCNSCHFITNSKEYMELHIKEHQPPPELGRCDNSNVKNLDNSPSCTTYFENQLDSFSNDMDVFSHDVSSDVSTPYRTYRCQKCDFSTHFIKFFKSHLDKHTGEALQQHLDLFSDNIPGDINNQAICNKDPLKKDCRMMPVDPRNYISKNCKVSTQCVMKNIDSGNSMTNLTKELEFPELETQIIDSENCDIDHDQVKNDNGNETISEFDQGKQYRCEMCDFSTNFQEYLDLHVRKHTCNIDKQSSFKGLENFHPTDNYDNGGATNEAFVKKEMNMWEKLDPCIHKTLEVVGDSTCELKISDQLQEHHFSAIQECWLNLQENNLKNVSGKETKMIQYEYCNYTTKLKENMTVHENNHIVNKMYKCKKCEFSTNFSKFFKAHLESHTPNERPNVDHFSKSEIPSCIGKPNRVYKCKKCDFSTHFIKFLKAHFYKHTAEALQPYVDVFF